MKMPWELAGEPRNGQKWANLADLQPPRPDPRISKRRLDAKMGNPPLSSYALKPCAYCGVLMVYYGRVLSHGEAPDHATRDHAFPKSDGWRLDDFDGANRVVCCYGCNQDKGRSDIVDWHIRLAVGGDPRAPHVLAVIRGLWDSLQRNAFVPSAIRAKLNLARLGVHIPANKRDAMLAARATKNGATAPTPCVESNSET
jgi:hypothetical protein